MAAMNQPAAPLLPTPQGPNTSGIIALLVGATVIGLAPILVKLSEAGPVATAFWRVGLALPLLLSWMGLQRRSEKRRGPKGPTARPSRLWLIVPGLFFAADLAAWHWSLELTSAANATLLANLAPVLVVLAGWLWLGERFRAAFVVGLALALAGTATLMASSPNSRDASFQGDALGLLTAVFYAGYQLSVKRLRDHYGVATILTWSAAASAILLLPIAIFSGEKLLAVSVAGWAVLVGLAVLSHICGQGLIAWAMGHLPVSFSSVSLLWQPVVAAGLAWVILDESLVPLQAGGGLAVLAGIFLARRGSIMTPTSDRTDLP